MMWGYLSINSSEKSWILRVPSKTDYHDLLTYEHAQIEMGSWKKDIQIVDDSLIDQMNSDSKDMTKVCIQLCSDKIEIGPFIGILTTGKNGSIKGNKRNFRDIIREGQRSGAFVYVIPVSGINLETQTVLGYYYDFSKKKWYEDTFPLPHIIYNRIPNRRAESNPDVQEVIKQLEKVENITFYNPQFFNKSHLYTILQRNELISHFIPETVPYGFEQLQSMLQQYPILYIKPENGRAGRGIFVVRNQNDEYILQNQVGKKIITISFHSVKELNRYMTRLLTKPYLIQQGIQLATYRNRNFDFRVLVQKDGCNRWKVTGIGARVAKEDGITTHVPRGGAIQDPQVVLGEAFPRVSNQEMIDSLESMVLSIAEILENHWPSLAEVSMDIGLDKGGKLWFIEANSKPEKFNEPEIRKLSLQRIIEYAQVKSHLKGGMKDDYS